MYESISTSPVVKPRIFAAELISSLLYRALDISRSASPSETLIRVAVVLVGLAGVDIAVGATSLLPVVLNFALAFDGLALIFAPTGINSVRYTRTPLDVPKLSRMRGALLCNCGDGGEEREDDCEV